MRRLAVELTIAVGAMGVAMPLSVAVGRGRPFDLAQGKPAAQAYAAPRTPWGEPDLQGSWTSDDMRGIPLERPEAFGTRQFLTDEEFAERIARDEQTGRQERSRAYGARYDLRSRTFRQTSLIVDPPDGRIPALTPLARSRATPRDRGSFGLGPFDGPEDFTLFDRCITRGVVGSVLPVIYGNGNQIVQAPGLVAITYEMVHDTRLIPLDARAHPGSGIRLYMGDSRGRWEGNTLVIETANFTGRTSVAENGNGLRHTDGLRLVERISRVDAFTLDYRVTIDDPATYVRPWTISLSLTSPRGYDVLPYECHEGNHGLPNILSAERSEDGAIDEDARRGIIRARRRPPNDLDRPAAEGSER
jgi:hypothetical protein